MRHPGGEGELKFGEVERPGKQLINFGGDGWVGSIKKNYTVGSHSVPKMYSYLPKKLYFSQTATELYINAVAEL